MRHLLSRSAVALMIASICVISPAILSGAASSGADGVAAEAARLRLCGHYEEALALYEGILADDVADPEAWLGRTDCLCHLERPGPDPRPGEDGSIEAAVFAGKGYALMMAGAYVEAGEQAERASALEPGEPLYRLLLGEVAYRDGNPREAADLYRESIVLARRAGDGRAVARAVLARTLALLADGRPREALKDLDQETKAFEELGDALLLCRRLHLKAVAFRKLGMHAKALGLWEEFLEGSEALGVTRWRSDALAGIAEASARLGRYDAALAAWADAVEISLGLADGKSAARAYRRIGRINHLIGEYERALEIFEASEQIGGGPEDTGSTALLIHKANAMFELGRYRDAAGLYEEAVLTAETLAEPRLQGDGLCGLGLVHTETGRWAEALSTLWIAFQYHGDAGDLDGMIADLNNIGSIHYRRGSSGKAAEYFTLAADLCGPGCGPYSMGVFLGNLGVARGALGEYDDALASLGEALILHREIGARGALADDLLNAGELCLGMDRLDRGTRHLEEALALAEATGSPGILWQAHFGLGRVREREGRADGALEHYRRAVESLWALYEESGGWDRNGLFLADKVDLFEAVLDILVRMHDEDPSAGYDVEAFVFMERGRILALMDDLGKIEIRFDEGRAERLYRDYRAASARLRALRVRAGDADAGNEEVLRLRERTWGAKEELQRLRNNLASERPELGRRLRGGEVDLVMMQSRADPETAYIEYSVLKDRLLLFVVTRGGLFMRTVWISRAALEEKLSEFRSILESGGVWTAASEERFADLGRELYDILIGPVEAEINGYRRLGIVPQGKLFYLPFQALLQCRAGGDCRYLVESHAVFYLNALALGGEASLDGPGSGLSLIGFGNADDTLPSAAREVKSILDTHRSSSIFLGPKATETTLKARCREFDILHVASHGRISPASPMESYLSLAPSMADDGRLTIEEIYGLETGDLRLVTLSACHTAFAIRGRGEEVTSLSEAFLSAGVPTLVATLWQIDDHATGLLMEEFYRNLPASGPVEAMRTAQLAFVKGRLRPTVGRGPTRGLDGPYYSGDREGTAPLNGWTPFFWAPFVVFQE